MELEHEDDKFEDICRVCLTISNTMRYHSLLEDPLKTSFYECTSISVPEDSRSTTVLCSFCVARCEAAQYFRNKASEAHLKLNKLINRETETIEENDPRENTDHIEEEDEEEEIYEEEENEVIDDDGDITEETQPEYEEVIEESQELVTLVPDEDLFAFAYEPEYTDASKLVYVPQPQSMQALPATLSDIVNHRCPLCENFLADKNSLMHHYQKDHPNVAYPCPTCSKSFLSVDLWSSHICKSTSAFCCSVCRKVVSSRALLTSHMTIHSTDQYTCEVCEKVFVGMRRYKDHLRRHNKSRRFKCDFCEKTFKEMRDLRRHNMLKHVNSKLFSCTQCHRSFGLRYMLKRHMQVSNSRNGLTINLIRKLTTFFQLM